MRLLLLTFVVPLAFAGDLFRDDFSRFRPGLLSQPMGQLNGAIQEYHYIEHRGVRTHPWRNPIVHTDHWAAGDEAGKPYLEQHQVVDDARYLPLFVTGDNDWSDYTVEAKVRPLSKRGRVGLVFRYRTSRHFYAFLFEEGTHAKLILRLPVDSEFRKSDYKELAAAPFTYETTRYYTLRVENRGPQIRAFIDGKQILESSHDEILKGHAGLVGNTPVRYQSFAVTAPDSTAAQIRSRIAARDAELERLRGANPKPKLWRKFDTPEFGAGRNVRFGDLDGDGRVDMLIGQNVPKVRGDAYDQLSCLTAVTLEGKVIWQQGRANPANGLLTNDTPFQIHDVDGDGRNEVVLVRDFELQILEGRTGELRKSALLPKALPNNLSEMPHEYTNGDSLLFLNASGAKSPREILLKDRYRGFWLYNANLEMLWEGRGQTGHFPYPFDADNDGKQEFVIGYAMWSPDGKMLWSHDRQMKDHADAISVGNYSGRADGPLRAYICGSDEGLVIIERDGRIHKHIRLGHAQTQSVGKYRRDLPGLQVMIANFWRNPGIVSLFDHDGNMLAQDEMVPGSTHLAPVNWRGDGQEFALLSGNLREGGMIDGELRRVVMFPDDGHPDLAYHVADLTGDARDEIILWDQKRVWIYTQDRPFTGTQIYKPRRNPDYNESNYRATVSLPR
ncbi:MAG: hypothetical protein JNL98_23845 [Bryobacterales bacterium]|nr:hypothetical protein [Bryobacterales bacterium]